MNLESCFFLQKMLKCYFYR